MTDLAKNIKRLRQSQNMTQADLADKLHVTRQTVSSWERSNSTPDLSLVPAIAEALGTDERGLLYPGEAKKDIFRPGCAFVLGSVVFYALLMFLFGIWGAFLGLFAFNAFWAAVILESISEK